MRKLGVKSAHRKCMLKNLATDTIIYEKIVTTHARAKETQKLVEKLITCAKNNTYNSRKKALKFLYIKTYNESNSYKKLFDELSQRYKDRCGGYTRITKLGQRKGDGSMEVLLELV